ncbi:BNI5 [Cyberlindnera jadinii]|uniref:BNI5 protein n=1 Tax=Cyberlindnera jadinii (strain ATCC 18201 / CBS 1600 / BCRC 20928 / JCM 3617 / NBRC 0987 / NRRL Y-1542) TaxID=983966 RepID=A0A0H5C2R8_CYBJN|nr:hypothetical protein CYBJADRAFT_18810 [Cyberlindnera jadinii NRRL Y-1542]ODV72248.1 hypothetical protein CYBJADRAFT_18810 [Cyberlindnera jadinii NRRL Y-1542]CEP21907.1 BNI5 [Cyberlindnera jadinii]
MSEPSTPPNEQAEDKQQVDTTDEQIDNLLREVEELKASSPIKPIQRDDDETSDGEREVQKDDVALSDHSSHRDSTTQTDVDVVDVDVKATVGDTTANGVKENGVIESTNGANKANVEPAQQARKDIPKSVSQALFTPLKVMRVRERDSAPKFVGIKSKDEDEQSRKKIESLQQREQELAQKTRKLQKEIDYLNNLIDTAGVSSDLTELRKLKYAIERLNSFLDQKEKEKYEVGIQLTRALRKRVDSGDYGEFWSN